MKIIYNKISIYLFTFILAQNLASYSKDNCFPEKSNRLVNDYVGILSLSQLNQLEHKLVQFANNTSNQIAIVIVKDLCGYNKADYTIRLGEKWGVGQKGFDNGVVIMVKPTGSTGERQTFIAIGYGLEGAIPDAIAKRIVEYEMIPKFKNNNFYGGLDAATTVIMKLAKGEFTAKDYKRSETTSTIIAIIIILLFVFIFILSRYQRVKSYASMNHIGFWAAWALLSASSNQHRGHYGNFNSGTGSFGGFGGGGFGGFGGGGFGGGGAGGSW
ncbi:MAG: TPM domain-containing protein [Bacteroidales bacterium]|nr:TPM domain-containing protein [Bacteroidales bacterium]